MPSHAFYFSAVDRKKIAAGCLKGNVSFVVVVIIAIAVAIYFWNKRETHFLIIEKDGDDDGGGGVNEVGASIFLRKSSCFSD